MYIISDLMINEQIRDKEVRVVSETGEQLGIMSSKEAQQLADEQGVDLIKIAPTAKPPVCKIMDYGKFRYEQTRREKEAKKKQRIIDIKEVRLSPNIDDNDLNTKANMQSYVTRSKRTRQTTRCRISMHFSEARRTRTRIRFRRSPQRANSSKMAKAKNWSASASASPIR